MRTVTYNILDGGVGRADPLAEVILAQSPDVVCLVEADDDAVVDRLARRLGMDFVVAPGRNHSSALMSRWAIRTSVNHALTGAKVSRSFLEAEVVDPTGRGWPVGVIHLPAGPGAGDEKSRMVDLAEVLRVFERHRKNDRPHLICGDFNANAPYRLTDPAKCTARSRDAWAHTGVPHDVIGAMLGAGYLDTYRVGHDETVPSIGSFTTQHPGQRVDYIFAFGVPAESVADAWIETDRLAKYAGDHFPVGAEIRMWS
jgi:endonuclease/exonuclease/phosphatase family metal-dependent hydrolase